MYCNTNIASVNKIFIATSLMVFVQVKEFISRAKAWRNKKWPKSTGGSGRPKSYLISLLVLRAYETASTKVSAYDTTAIARK